MACGRLGCLRGSDEFLSNGYCRGDKSILFGLYHSKAGIDCSGVGEAGEVRVVVCPSWPLSELSEELVSSEDEEDDEKRSVILLIASTLTYCGGLSKNFFLYDVKVCLLIRDII